MTTNSTTQGRAAMKHGEPVHEYQTEEKAKYREVVWSTFAESVPEVEKAKVLFFPGRHGLEIPVALAHGFKEENLIACEENTAIIATAKWRKEYPAVKCYGTSLNRTAARLIDDHVSLDAANLDFCSNLCHGLMADILTLLDTQSSEAGLTLAVTLLKGREDRTVADMARLVFKAPNGSVNRTQVVQMWLARHGYCNRTLSQGEYRSGSKNMVFVALATRHVDKVRAQCERFLEAHLPEVKSLLALDDKVTEPQSFKQFLALQEEFDARRQVLSDAKREMFWEAERQWEYKPELHLVTNASRLWYLLGNIPCRRHRFPRPGTEAWREEVADFNAQLRQRLIASEAEKIQLLQAGRAYR